MSSIVLNKNQTDKDLIKNIVGFFHESINNFKSTLTELSVAISNFLNSLNQIETQLEIQGYHYEINSSSLLYERLTKDKQDRVNEQKDLILKLTSKIKPLNTVVVKTPNQNNIQDQGKESLEINQGINKVLDLKIQQKEDKEEFITKLRAVPLNTKNIQQIKRTKILRGSENTQEAGKVSSLKSPLEYSKETVITNNLKKEMLKRLRELKKIMKNQ
ncbi:MAG: hypothetical protein ACTSO9_09105 [Candidatus Helarchaeota archaeon]